MCVYIIFIFPYKSLLFVVQVQDPKRPSLTLLVFPRIDTNITNKSLAHHSSTSETIGDDELIENIEQKVYSF